MSDAFVHPTAVVDEGAVLGHGTKVWHFSHIMGTAVLGPGCNLGQNVYVDKDVRIGAGVKIQNNVSVYKGVTLEDDVFCGPSCVFTNVINPRSAIERKNEFKRTLVGKGATIGANSTIVCGADIGRHALIGAGAVVTKDLPDFALVVGVPAKRIGWVCACGVTLPAVEAGATRCMDCGAMYVEADGLLRENQSQGAMEP